MVAQAGASGQQLVGYVVPHDPALAEDVGAQAACRDALRKALKERLPEYMLPAHLLFLACMPLTPTASWIARACPSPVPTSSNATTRHRAAVERQLATIWAEVLKLEQVGLADNFFEIGGDSIISLQVVSRARQLGIHFTPKMLFEAQTIGALAPLAERYAGAGYRPGTGDRRHAVAADPAGFLRRKGRRAPLVEPVGAPGSPRAARCPTP